MSTVTAIGLAISLLWTGFLLGARMDSSATGNDPVADALVAALDEARSARGRQKLHRVPLLDAVAARRAAATARLPERRRFEEKAPIETLIRDAGRRRFSRAMQYLAYQGGYVDDAATAVQTWKAYAPGWEQATRDDWAEAGAATVRAADGTLVIVVVLLDPGRALPAVESIEESVVAGVNRERQRRGLVALALDPRLVPVARSHSADMSRRGYFDHASPEGVHVADRVSAAGIVFKRVAENLFESRHADDPVASAVASWMRSPGHRENILDPAFTHTGVGVAVDPDDGAVVMTQLFLRPPGIMAPREGPP